MAVAMRLCVAPPEGRVTVVGVTCSAETGSFLTRRVRVPASPLIGSVAVMTTLPALTPVTSPDSSTVAIAVLLEVHTTAGRDTTSPPLATPVACTWRGTLPSTGIVVDDAVTSIPASGFLETVIASLPTMPVGEYVTDTTAFPAARPVTMPAAPTLATAG